MNKVRTYKNHRKKNISGIYIPNIKYDNYNSSKNSFKMDKISSNSINFHKVGIHKKIINVAPLDLNIHFNKFYECNNECFKPSVCNELSVYRVSRYENSNIFMYYF